MSSWPTGVVCGAGCHPSMRFRQRVAREAKTQPMITRDSKAPTIAPADKSAASSNAAAAFRVDGAACTRVTADALAGGSCGNGGCGAPVECVAVRLRGGGGGT